MELDLPILDLGLNSFLRLALSKQDIVKQIINPSFFGPGVYGIWLRLSRKKPARHLAALLFISERDTCGDGR